MELMEEVGLRAFADTLAVELPYGRKRTLEIATTLALEPGADAAGRAHLTAWATRTSDLVTSLIQRVAAQRTILMVEHNLSVVANLCSHHHRAPARDASWPRGPTRRSRRTLR